MKTTIYLKQSLIALSFSFASVAHSMPSNSKSISEPLPYLTELRAENTNTLMEVDLALDQLMASSNSLKSLESLDGQVQILKKRKAELIQRQSFLNRMILQFDSKFRGGDVQQFLKVSLKEMSQIDVKSQDSGPSLWKFLNYLAISLESLPQGHIDVMKFVEGYMKRSPMNDPIEPKEYLSSLDYYNGVQAQSATGMTPSEAADSLEQRSLPLQQL
ncbi:hypothetical protein GW916_00750 [bacterium]|nr:hypothetical protein [bacterium]